MIKTIFFSLQCLIVLVVLVMRSRVKLVVAHFREAGKFIHAILLLLLLPIWT